MSIKPAVRDGYESSPIVRKAVDALDMFGGDLSQRQARTLLSMWRFNFSLTEAERTAILARFPRTCQDIGDPGNSGPGF